MKKENNEYVNVDGILEDVLHELHFSHGLYCTDLEEPKKEDMFQLNNMDLIEKVKRLIKHMSMYEEITSLKNENKELKRALRGYSNENEELRQLVIEYSDEKNRTTLISNVMSAILFASFGLILSLILLH